MKLNKKQKRTATIASMAALLAVVLGMGGQTFAKYISTQDVAATATVAKWGFVVNEQLQSDAAGMFKNTYENGGKVIAKATDPIVAPGVTGGSFTISVSGNAEVRAQFAVRLTDGFEDVYLKDGSTTYYPIKWTVTSGGTATNYESLAALQTALNTNKIFDETVEVGNNVSKSYTISWDWAFEDNDDAGNSKPTTLNNLDTTTDASDKLTINEADTILGMAAASKTINSGYDAHTKLSFNFEISLTQIK